MVNPYLIESDMCKAFKFSLLILTVALSSGCATVKYSALEKVGVHKRDILVDRVADAKKAQGLAKQQFLSTYERFVSLLKVDGGDLEKNYKRLKSDLDRSESKAAKIDDRLAAVETVAKDLFAEWRHELDQYSSQKLRDRSEQRLAITQERYQQLMQKMYSARDKITPLLQIMQDNTLFLKHNLNAQALTSLKGEMHDIKSRVDDLVQEMESAIREANRFIEQGSPGG